MEYDLKYKIHGKEDWKEINLSVITMETGAFLFFKISTMRIRNYFYNLNSLSEKNDPFCMSQKSESKR